MIESNAVQYIYSNFPHVEGVNEESLKGVDKVIRSIADYFEFVPIGDMTDEEFTNIKSLIASVPIDVYKVLSKASAMYFNSEYPRNIKTYSIIDGRNEEDKYGKHSSIDE